MNDNLIPTPITDKNGKQTTVRKKPATSASPGAASIPAPAIRKPATEAATGRLNSVGKDADLSDRFYDLLLETDGGRQMGMDKTVFIMTTTDRMRSLFCDLLERKEGFGDIISAATSPSLPDKRKPGAGTLESIGLVYDKDLFEEFPNLPKNFKLTKARKGFQKLDAYRNALSSARYAPIVGMERQEIMNLGEQPKEKVELVRKYVRFHDAFRLLADKNDVPSEGLSTLALNGEYPLEAVTTLMREHQTTDVNVIAGLLEGVTPSIAEGWL
jgi:hypothetical protein